jgi:hypothetical protein
MQYVIIMNFCMLGTICFIFYIVCYVWVGVSDIFKITLSTSVEMVHFSQNVIGGGTDFFPYVWLTVHLEVYLYNKPAHCTVYLHFIELPYICMFQAHL